MTIENGEGLNEEPIEEMAELSLNTVVRISNLHTIKIKGKFENEEVMVLVDCGATHIFISPRVVDKLNFLFSILPTIG